MRIPARPCLVAVGLIVTGVAAAHHSFVTHYVTDEVFRISGTITKVQLRNPHSFYYLDVDVGDGTVEHWELEAQSVALLRRMGIDGTTVVPGQKLTVVGMHSRDPDRKLMFANEFILEDGERHVMNRIQDDSVVQQPGIPLPEEGRFAATTAEQPLPERIAGVWARRSAGAHDVFNRGGDSPMPLNEAGLAARAAYDPLNTPAKDCIAPNYPALLYAPYLLRISVSDDAVLFEHEYYEVTRSVSLRRGALPDAPAAEFGHAAGTLRDDALIVESNGYLAHPAGLASDWDGNGRGKDIPASARKRLREEYTVSADTRYLHLNLTIEDPVYLSEPFHTTRVWERAGAEVAFQPIACDPEAARRSSSNAIR